VQLQVSPPNEDFSRLEGLFDQALALPAEERDAFLSEACSDDVQTLGRLRALLVAHESEQQASGLRLQSARANGVPVRRLGPYELETLLGRGGMGAVYLAHRADGQYEKKVAIKVVDLPLATETFYDRFRQERQILAGLDHPHIARLLDGGVSDDGILFLVMEYVDGVRIDEYCTSHELTVEAKLQLFMAVCSAVQFAHQNMVVHRDLKPDNVLVSDEGTPYLLDFGTAKLISRDVATDTRGLTREGFLSFTPEYASPEQVLGRPVATTSDTYSLGVLLYQMLAGHLPYELSDFSAEEMIRIICEQPIKRPTSTDRTFPNGDLEAILGKALRKEPEQRYQTAEQFVADIRAYLEHRPVLAHKGDLRYRARKFVRRYRLAMSFAAILTVTVIVGVAAVLWQAHVARVAERASEESATNLSQLSDSLLTELDGAIQRLPGSTGAQQVLVGRLVEHLDRMSKNPRINAFTQVSLANAYVRLANLQANPYEQNIGDTPGALRSLDKALAITQPLAAARPKDTTVLLSHARAQDARGEILSFADDNAGAAQSLEASSKTYDQLLALPGASAALFFEAGSVIDILGDVMGQDIGFSDWEAALRNYYRAIEFDHRALAVDPAFKPSRRGLATMQMKVGNAELDVDPTAALADFYKAMAILDALPQSEQKRLDLIRLRGLLLRKEAVALSDLGRYAEAIPLFDKSRSIYQGIADADAKDVRALRDLDRLLTVETFSYENAADPLLAAASSSPAQNVAKAKTLEMERISVLERLQAASPDDAWIKQELASVTVRLNALQNAGPSKRDSDALATLRAAAVRDKASPLQLDLAFHAFTEARPASLRDADFALHCAEQGVALTHRRSPAWLLSLAQAYRMTGDTVKAGAVANEGLALLPNPSANIGFRLRKLMDAEVHETAR
jgi:tetratricopeptide (TPR) repeat protein